MTSSTLKNRPYVILFGSKVLITEVKSGMAVKLDSEK